MSTQDNTTHKYQSSDQPKIVSKTRDGYLKVKGQKTAGEKRKAENESSIYIVIYHSQDPAEGLILIEETEEGQKQVPGGGRVCLNCDRIFYSNKSNCERCGNTLVLSENKKQNNSNKGDRR